MNKANQATQEERARTLLDPEACGVIVIDVQDAFLQLLSDRTSWLNRLSAFLQIPKALSIPILVTEQTPEKLGSTADSIRQAVPEATMIPKETFDCFDNDDVRTWMEEQGIEQLLLTGVMSNVCVLQTTLRALEDDYLVHVASDGVQAASSEDDWWGLRRINQAGAIVTTLETATYEWLRSPEHPRFSDLLPVLKKLQPAPEKEEH